jgi:hypothetical protein
MRLLVGLCLIEFNEKAPPRIWSGGGSWAEFRLKLPNYYIYDCLSSVMYAIMSHWVKKFRFYPQSTLRYDTRITKSFLKVYVQFPPKVYLAVVFPYTLM